MKRHPDGRFRGNRSPAQVTDRILISRWVEREVIRLKRMGIASFETIADLLTRAGSRSNWCARSTGVRQQTAAHDSLDTARLAFLPVSI